MLGWGAFTKLIGAMKKFTDILFATTIQLLKWKKIMKPVFLSKLDVMKATKLRNENRSASIDG
jgi:hypothetical protein